MKNKILIIGNLGYIGPVLTKHLRSVSADNKVTGMDTGYFSSCLLSPYLDHHFLPEQQIYVDVRNIKDIDFPKVDSVVYLAAISNDPMGNVYATQTKQINQDSAIECAKLAKNLGARNFIFASSCSVYGAGGNGFKDESDDLNPLTAYARSKIDSEIELKEIASNNFSVTCLRFATACGTSPRLRLDLVLNDFVASALLNKKIEILSDGTQWRPLIDVEDMCKAVHWAMNRNVDSTTNFLTLNIGFNEWNFNIKQLAEAVNSQINDTIVSIDEKAAPDKRSYKVNFSLYDQLAPENRQFKLLSTSIQEIARTIESSLFREPNFRQSHLIRLNALNQLKLTHKINDQLYWI